MLMTQYVTEPTRLCNILDLVLSNDHMLISDCTVGVPFGLSDHNSVEFSIVTELNSPTTLQTPEVHLVTNWSNANWGAFLNYCRKVNWDDILSVTQSPNELWSAFTGVLKSGIGKFVPTSKFIQRRKNNKISDRYVLKLKVKKLKLWRKYKKQKTTKNR
jgi:hypothetical protein